MQHARRGALVVSVVIAFSFGAAACARDTTASSDLQDQHRQILSRLADLERKIDRLASRPTAMQQPVGPDPLRTYDLPVEGSPLKGPADAPITIVEFADYQCPFCARSERVLEEVLKAYPTQARLVYKHFPLTANHPHALPAALAAAAAQRQGKFWPMHALLFANQRALSPEQIEGYARQLGLDMARFEADMASEDVRAQVDADRRLARRAGVRGTPTVFVNGRVVPNRTVEGFRHFIEPLIEQAERRSPPTPQNG